MKSLFLILALIGILIISCSKDAEIQKKDYPLVSTKSISNVTDSSIEFNGILIESANVSIQEYGFIWDIKEPDLNVSKKIIMNTTIKEGNFSKVVDLGIFKDIVQYVKAYLKTKDLIVYGNTISFKCNGGRKAIIESVNPLSGYSNTEVTIKGKYFGDSLDNAKVYFGNRKAEIIYVTDSVIVVKVPKVEFDSTDYLTIESYGKTINSSIRFTSFSYWKRIAAMPGASRSFASSFSINGKGYVGFGRPDVNYYAGLDDFWEYDPDNNQWKKKATLPNANKSDAIGCCLNNTGYVAFGNNYNSTNNTISSCYDIFSYDQDKDTWAKVLTDSTIEMSNMGIPFIIDNKLYITLSSGFRKFDPLSNKISNYGTYHSYSISWNFGFSTNSLGYTLMRDWSGIYHLMEYNPTTNLWTQLDNQINSVLLIGYAFNIGDRVFVISGYNESYKNTIYEYKITDNSLSQLSDFPGDSRKYFTCFVIKNKAYIGTGYNGNTYNDFYEFDPTKK